MTAQLSLLARDDRGADISTCGRYRHRLWRRWGDGPAMTVVMLNPSTADANDDDPTIRRCIAFAKRDGFAGLMVVNLLELRATDPTELTTAADPVGPDVEREFLRAEILAGAENGCVLVGWGAHPATRSEAARHAIGIVRKAGGMSLRALRINSDGSPGHPLYLPRSSRPMPWPTEAA